MRAIIQAYPAGLRHQALADFGRAMGLPAKTLREIDKLIAPKGSAASVV
jgi:hypothetical protein